MDRCNFIRDGRGINLINAHSICTLHKIHNISVIYIRVRVNAFFGKRAARSRAKRLRELISYVVYFSNARNQNFAPRGRGKGTHGGVARNKSQRSNSDPGTTFWSAKPPVVKPANSVYPGTRIRSTERPPRQWAARARGIRYTLDCGIHARLTRPKLKLPSDLTADTVGR